LFSANPIACAEIETLNSDIEAEAANLYLAETAFLIALPSLNHWYFTDFVVGEIFRLLTCKVVLAVSANATWVSEAIDVLPTTSELETLVTSFPATVAD
jgi:hypothetical protein